MGVAEQGPIHQNFCNWPLMRFISFASNIGPAAAVPAGLAPAPLIEKATTPFLSTVPTPTVTLLSPTVGTPYVGTRFILNCNIQLSQTVDSPVTLTVLWRRSGVLISNDTQTTVHNVAQNGSHTYLSMLVFSSLSLTLDSGQYTCEASASANPPSPYITGSLSATSTAYSLTVEQPSKLL